MLDDALNALQPGNPGVTQIAPTPLAGGLLGQQQAQSPEMQQAIQMLQQAGQNPQAMAQFGTQMQKAMQAQQTPVQQFGQWMQDAANYDPDNKQLGQMAGMFRRPDVMADQKGSTELMNIMKSGGWGQGDMSNAAYNRSLNRGD